MKHLLHIFITVVCIAVVAGCADNSRLRDEIDRAGRLADTCPDSAIALLDSLSPAINQADRATRMRYDLMLIKSRDKAYIEHRNDSMIAPVVEYFTGHTDPDLTPLALYYAGRVYSDLGDAPRALDYYQQALDAIPDSHDNLMLRYLIHGQMSDIYTFQHIYDKSLSCNRQALETTIKMNDSIRIGRIMEHIAIDFRNLNIYDSAAVWFNKAIEWVEPIGNQSLTTDIKAQFAALYLDEGYLELADSILKPILSDFHSLLNQYATHSIAINLYIAKKELPKALPHIYWSLSNGNIYGKRLAYGTLANIKIRENDIDSAIIYMNLYKLYSDSINDSYQVEKVAKVNAAYNYALYERDNKLLLQENSNNRLLIIILSALILVLSIAIIMTHRYNRIKRMLVDMRVSLLDAFGIGLKQSTQNIQSKDISAEDAINSLRQYDIVNRFIYEFGNPKNTINATDEDWRLLELAIEDVYPGFKNRLLSLFPFSDTQIKACLMIKVYMPNVKMAHILNRSEGAISVMRKRMYKSVFNTPTAEAPQWDSVIRSL